MVGCPSAADFERIVRGNMLIIVQLELPIFKKFTQYFPRQRLPPRQISKKNRNSNVGLCGNPQTDERQDENNLIHY